MNYSYKGKILISTPDVSGDIFSRSVVLIIDHNENGAFGLILNKKMKNNNIVIQEMSENKIDIYEGGPVEQEKIFFIVKGVPISENFMEISDDYYITEDFGNILNAVFEKKLNINDLKAFSGYSGWAAQQLEGEIHKKFWTVVDIMNLDYTIPNDHNLWKNMMQNLGGEFLIWANAPENISLN